MLTRNILLPVRKPDQVAQSLPAAARVANAFHAELTIMQVSDPFREGGPKPISFNADSLRLGANVQLPERCRFYSAARSDAAAGVVDFARKQNLDAILLRNQPAVSFSKFSFFSERVLQDSPCPVWLLGDEVAKKPTDDFRLTTILCPVSGRDLDVVKAAASLSKQWGARLFLLHVMPEVHEGLLAYGFDDHVALSVQTASELLDKLRMEANVDAQPVVQVGNLRKVIKRTAQLLDADLVVMGNYRRRSEGASWNFARSFIPYFGCQTLFV